MQDESSNPRMCACGCGQPTAIAKKTSPVKGHVKGQGKKWVHGHHARAKTHQRDRECIEDGCARPANCLGLCRRHYDQQRYHAPRPRPKFKGRTSPPRACEHCGESYAPIGRQRWCSVCVPDASARSRMKRYGLNQADFAAMVAAQGGTCALCWRPPGAVDHCHATGRIRGLLCLGCNARLHAIDNAEWLAAATAYVKKEVS